MPDWHAIDERIRTAIACERMLMLRTCGKAIGDLLLREREDTARAMRDEVRSLKIEISKLASESAALREQLAGERGRVLDSPPLSRQVN
jgi:hypothetical protein